MKRIALVVTCACLFAAPTAGQNVDIKFIADTLVVEAQGTYEADPDLATLTFDVSSQQKELKQAYSEAAQSVERIVNLAEKSGLKKANVSTGVLTVQPSYQGDRKRKARSYLVQGQITLKVHDFSQIGPILDGSVEEGIVDFRSLTYSLSDEEAAKQRAASEAMRRAMGRANAALAEKGQKVGALRYANLDVRKLEGVAQLVNYSQVYSTTAQEVTVSAEGGWGGGGGRHKAVASLPEVRPEKITVSATVQCAFQIL